MQSATAHRQLVSRTPTTEGDRGANGGAASSKLPIASIASTRKRKTQRMWMLEAIAPAQGAKAADAREAADNLHHYREQLAAGGDRVAETR